MIERTHPNPMTIAYIAIGASHALQDYFADGGGCLTSEEAFVRDVVGHALMLDRKADVVDNGVGFSGVFTYEVAEPFGMQLAKSMPYGQDLNAEQLADELIEAAS